MTQATKNILKDARILIWSLVLVASIMAVAVKWQRHLPPKETSGVAAIGGAFSLVDPQGRSVTDKSLIGHISIIYFGYSFCPDACPTALAAISEGLSQFEAKYPNRGKQVQPIFITVDPERDTPSIMGVYAKNFHPRLLALSGSPQQVKQAMQAYRVFAAKRVEAGDVKNYLVDHAAVVYIMGMNGQYLSNISGAVTAAHIVSALDRSIP